jgi:PST family polysaccharide transporter
VRLHKQSVPDEPRKGLGGRVRSAAAWTALDVAVNRGSGFVIGVVVARLLEPHDFGIYAVALVVHAIVINISELGVSTALVREEASAADETGPTIVTIAVVTSFVLGALMAASASTLARLLGAPAATSTIQVMAITLPLAGLSAVPAALLRRDFRMDRLFVADTANSVASGAVVIVLALAGWGPLALAWAFVAGQLLTTVILLLQPVTRYRPGWSRKQARRLLRFGLPLAGANVLAFAIQNVDYVIVGRLMGSVDLGLYVLAFNVSGWPQNVFSSVVRSVSVPAFSRLRERGSDMPRDFGIALRTVARVTLPVCLILGALAHPLIRTVYGSKWDLAYAPLIGLAVMAAARAMIELFSDFLVSLGRTRAVMLFPLVWLPTLTVALLVLVRRDGIAGAGIAQAAVSWLVIVPVVAYLVSRSGVRQRIVMRALLPPLGWAVLTAGAAWLVSTRLTPPLLACAAGGSIGLGLYILPYVPALRRALLKERARRRSATAPVDEADDLTAAAESSGAFAPTEGAGARGAVAGAIERTAGLPVDGVAGGVADADGRRPARSVSTGPARTTFARSLFARYDRQQERGVGDLVTDASPRLLVISPVRNEAAHLEVVARAVAAQTLPPTCWVVVDDGSTDATPAILGALQHDIAFLSVIRGESVGARARDRLAAGAAPRAFNRGLNSVDWRSFTHIAKLDGDTELPERYFESLLTEFAKDPKLGLAGGVRSERADGSLERVPTDYHVPGALKCYSRPCLEAIGGMQERLAWDTIDEVSARMRGFRTRAFPELVAVHHRRWGSADGSLRGRARHGRCAYIVHYPALWILVRAYKSEGVKPRVLSSLCFVGGYLMAAVLGEPQVEDPEFRRFFRRELRQRIRRAALNMR